jgi:hypothetical protein
LVLGGLVVVLQTAPGQTAALDFALEQVQGALAGELSVGGVRSTTLLGGVSLDEVVLSDGTGRPVLSADSVVVRYLPTGLIAGSVRLRSVILWGMDLEISRLSETDDLNLSRLLAPSDPPPDSARRRTEIVFGQIGVRGGRVSVLSPMSPDLRAGASGVLPGPQGPLQRLGLDDMDLDLEDGVLSIDGGVSFRSDLASLAMRTSLAGRDEAMVMREAFGRLTFDLDNGIQIDEGAFRLPETLGRGTVTLGPVDGVGGWVLRAGIEVQDWGDLGDLRWADPRIPDGEFRGGADISTAAGLTLGLDGVDVRLADSNLAADGVVTFGDVLSTSNLTVVASPLVVSRISPWLEEALPLEGWLSGRATFSGPATDLRTTGRMTFVPVDFGGLPTTVDYSGRMHLGDDFGWTGLEARMDPLNWSLVEALGPDDLSFSGSGEANVQLDGRLRRGVSLVADFTHEGGSGTVSGVHVRGMVSRMDEGWVLNLTGDLAPLGLEVLGAVAPQLQTRGAVRGPVSARGPLDDLAVTADLSGTGGRLTMDATFDVMDPARAYRLALAAEDLGFAAYTDRVPDRTLWNGTLTVEGSGLALDSLRGSARLEMVASRIGGLTIDAVATHLRAEEGVLHADSLQGTVGGIDFEGSGQLGLRSDVGGSAQVRFSADSLVGLRPVLMGDSIMVRDDLTPLEGEMLRLQGIDPDTLPMAEEVRVQGAVVGGVEFSGRVTDFAADARFSLRNAAYGESTVDSAEVRVFVQGLPNLTRSWEVGVDAADVEWAGRGFERIAATGSMEGRSGSADLRVSRRADEFYAVAGDFALDSLGGSALLGTAEARLNQRTWNLARPSQISWAGDAVTVDSLVIRREGEDPMQLAASGTLARSGVSDLRLDVAGLHLERLGAMVREEPLDVSGHVDLKAHVRGPAANPLIDADLYVLDPRYESIALDSLAASLSYRDRATELSLEAFHEGRVALTASGSVPVDLTLSEAPDGRFLDEAVDISIQADSLDAALPLAYFGMLGNVDGTMTADVHVGGTTQEPVPSGTVRLAGGAWTIEALGVRHRGVEGTLELQQDQTMAVELSARGTGSSDVTGTIGLSPLSDPSLDLDVSFDRFRAMERRDIDGTISGAFTLTGTYQRPLVEGALTVDQGTLRVDEFSRAAGVVDLSDPRLFGAGLAVDTTVFMSQPILAEVRNPFLDNLRLDVDMSVPRNTWLRSNDMNVEMGGQLLVRYDRSAGDLVLVGELQALRGTYLVLGRTFEVDDGTASFIGRPGVNPSLNITADSRFRTSEGGQVIITAAVDGTLVQPRVTLTSENGELSQSDLISYLVFNQPAAQVGRSQQSFLGQVGAAGDVLGGATTIALGSLVNQNAAVLAQNLSLDYVAVSSGPASAEWAGLRSTQLEVGRYLSDDVFAVVTLRPVAEEGSRFGGLRVEWAFTDLYNFEAFVEDRFLRSGIGFLAIQDLGRELLYGLLFSREWGYNE